jgi:uncharacterized protein YlxW (UPF0749 family)
MKHASAITTALIITAVIGLGIMVIGLSAFTNKNIVPLQNSPNSNTVNTTNSNVNGLGSASSTTSDVQQLQQEVANLQNQLNQTGQTVQQYQNLLIALQQRGVIQIDQNGNIYIPQGESSFH